MLAWLKRLFRRLGNEAVSARRGREGERLSRRYLEHEGYRVLVRNWRSPSDRRDEIDLIALDRETLVFVEVKTRSEGALVSGRYAIDARKKRALRRAACAYLQRLSEPPRCVRFDVVEVILSQPAAVGVVAASARSPILHFKNVPLFPKDFGHKS